MELEPIKMTNVSRGFHSSASSLPISEAETVYLNSIESGSALRHL